MFRRFYVEKKEGFNIEGRLLKEELTALLGEKYPELSLLCNVRLLRTYDVFHSDEEQFDLLTEAVFSEPRSDRIFFDMDLQIKENERCFGIEYLPGQYDQRSDSAEQNAEFMTGIKPGIETSTLYILEGDGKPLSDETMEGVKKYLINPVDSREVCLEIPVLTGFIQTSNPMEFAGKYGLAMSMEDLLFCRDWFLKEGRDPTLTELKVLDTYWSDHCRHTTFNTILDEIKAEGEGPIGKALELYEKTRLEVYGDEQKNRRRSLMDIATIGTKALKKKGIVTDLDESAEVNACTVKINAEFADRTSEPWLLLFKNETHNHPTEIDPFSGAATCLGGAIRDPLSGRATVHQAMRVTGGGDPTAGIDTTLPGKLPQIKIAREAAAGYSSYGNQIGLAAGQVSEFYHPGFLAKRMEMGALIGAVPQKWVRREEPLPGDVVFLVGGRTGRDGIGGATSSSKVESNKAAANTGAEVPKGDAVEGRKLLRLFRKAEVCRLIKRCNDFGAGGVSVAVGELAAGLDIDLDKVPKKYPGLDGTELAVSESQERMAVVVSAADAEVFIKEAAAENLEAVIIAKVTAGDPVSAGINNEDKARLRMTWLGKTIVNISREFLNTNGAPRHAKVQLKGQLEESSCLKAEDRGAKSAKQLLDELEKELKSLRSGSRRGLQERFDGSAGAASVLFPLGGSEQGTPECGMAALLPSLEKQSLTASLMTFGYDPVTMSYDPYHGAKASIKEALAKFACLGGDPFKARLSLQEYFEKPVDPETWGRPAAALLGALEAQLQLGVPAIGGKDSMSGNFKAGDINITVPPTLVAFAAGTAPAASIRSGVLSGKAGNAVILLCANAAGKNEWEVFKTNMKTLHDLAVCGALKAAYPVGAGGIAATMAVMAFGNKTGVEAYADSFSQVNDMNYQGSILAEIDETALPAELKISWVPAGKTLDKEVFRIVGPEETAETTLEELRRAYESPLSKVYLQTSIGNSTTNQYEPIRTMVKHERTSSSSLCGSWLNKSILSGHGAPLVVLPVFPGTNCEWEVERAFRKAGAKTQLVIFRNRRRQDINESLSELVLAFREANIIAFPGGFGGGDEPAGSGKFISNVIRHSPVADAITDFLENRGGLILGICNGFQALVKTGLLPYGHIISPADTMPSLTFNNIGRHVSRMVYTRVMPNNSPWLSLEEPGTIHTIPVSHGEGRVVISDEEAEKLFRAGQIPFCYADARGNPSMAEPYNPNGSAFAIEALTSPDGRILGKMGHSERCGEFVHINIPGNKYQKIFEAGVGYFK